MNTSVGKALHRMRVRLAFVCVITTGVLLCTMAAVLLGISESRMETQRDESFRNSANSIIYRIQSSRVIDNAWLSQLEAGERLIIHIEDNTRPILFRGSWTPKTDRAALVALAQEKALSDFFFDTAARPYSVLTTEDIAFEIKGERNERYQVFISLIPSDVGWQSLTLLKDLDDEGRAKLLMRASFFAVILISLLLLLAFSLLFSKRATTQIEDANRKHVEFIAAASHELRAPLAIVKAGLSETFDETDAALTEKHRATVEREISRMAGLIDELLLLANADAQKLTVTQGVVDFDTLLTELYESCEMIARKKNQSLTLTLPDIALPMLPGDKQRLSQALTAVLDNAISYVPELGRISIEAQADKRALTVSIADDGPGIPDAEKARVFERFYRSDTAHSDKGHYGLGLSVAREIIELHGGKLEVSDSPLGGAEFTAKFPLQT